MLVSLLLLLCDATSMHFVIEYHEYKLVWGVMIVFSVVARLARRGRVKEGMKEGGEKGKVKEREREGERVWTSTWCVQIRSAHSSGLDIWGCTTTQCT